MQDATVQITLEGHENVVCNVTPGREFGILLRLVTLLIVIVVHFFMLLHRISHLVTSLSLSTLQSRDE